MYKLFLSFRYLRSKVFAYFAILGVALCVWMMLLSVSIFSGFLDKIERAAKGLFGDIVIEPMGERGLGHYDEFIAELERKVPEVEAADPFILSFGVLRVAGDNDFRQLVQIAGIRLPDRCGLTDFEEGMFIQTGPELPTFDPPLDVVLDRVEAYEHRMRDMLKRQYAEEFARLDPEKRHLAETSWWAAGKLLHDANPDMDAERAHELNRLTGAGSLRQRALDALGAARKAQPRREQLRRELAEAKQRGASEAELEGLRESLDELIETTGLEAPANRVILGLGIPGLSFRTARGQTVRYMNPGDRIILSVAPLGRRITSEGLQPNIRRFTIIDDNRSGVSSIDTKLVYLPFETLQELNNMSAEFTAEGDLVEPDRCSQIHVKVRGGKLTEQQLRDVAGQIRAVWADFALRHPRAATTRVGIETWRQRQANVVEPIESQRVLVIIVIGLMSVVAVVLIFVILYTIVVQKTREIGVLKAIGASSGGVAWLFFGYGAVIGLIGSVLGLVAGYFTITYINPLHDWVGRVTGIVFWSRDQQMFDRIPNEVDWQAGWVIFVGSVLAGLLGALIPAVRAARMQPVEALRYE